MPYPVTNLNMEERVFNHVSTHTNTLLLTLSQSSNAFGLFISGDLIIVLKSCSALCCFCSLIVILPAVFPLGRILSYRIMCIIIRYSSQMYNLGFVI